MATLAVSRHIHGAGTSEESWFLDSPLTTLPFVTPADLVPVGSRAVILAPHPDDEILPCGGLLAALSAARRDVLIIAITDGEGSHSRGSWWTPDRLRLTRPLESSEALARLDCEFSLVRLGLPDGGVTAQEDRLTQQLDSLIDARDVVFSPWSSDGHPDHEATAEASFIACAQKGARHIEMPIWGWHWSSPSTTPMPWDRAVRLPLGETQRIRKTRAIAAFASQLNVDPLSQAAPILTASTLERFVRPWEVYFL